MTEADRTNIVDLTLWGGKKHPGIVFQQLASNPCFAHVDASSWYKECRYYAAEPGEHFRAVSLRNLFCYCADEYGLTCVECGCVTTPSDSWDDIFSPTGNLWAHWTDKSICADCHARRHRVLRDQRAMEKAARATRRRLAMQADRQREFADRRKRRRLQERAAYKLCEELGILDTERAQT